MKNYKSIYTQAVEQINDIMTLGEFEVGIFGKNLQQVNVKSYQVTPLNVTEVEKALWSTLVMDMQFSYPIVTPSGGLMMDKMSKKFILFCPDGDVNIPMGILGKIWGTVYHKIALVNKPDTVAIDEEGIVYLVFIKKDKLSLQQCGEVSKADLEKINYCNVCSPYSFDIETEALYNYISGEVGWRYIRENMVLNFYIGTESETVIKVKLNLNKEFDGVV